MSERGLGDLVEIWGASICIVAKVSLEVSGPNISSLGYGCINGYICQYSWFDKTISPSSVLPYTFTEFK